MPLSIIIPCYNEYSRLYTTLPRLLEYCADNLKDYEIIFVNDGSTDDTLRLLLFTAVHNKRIRIESYGENRGKGYAVKHGMRQATKDYILFMDADLATDLTCIKAAIRNIKTMPKRFMLIGNREMPGSVVNTNIYRRLIGRVYATLQYLMLGLDISDTQCGFKICDSRTAKILCNGYIDGFSFDAEMLYMCKERNIMIMSMPVIWDNVAGSKISPVKDSLKMFIDLERIRILHKMIIPKIFRSMAADNLVIPHKRYKVKNVK